MSITSIAVAVPRHMWEVECPACRDRVTFAYNPDGGIPHCSACWAKFTIKEAK